MQTPELHGRRMTQLLSFRPCKQSCTIITFPDFYAYPWWQCGQCKYFCSTVTQFFPSI